MPCGAWLPTMRRVFFDAFRRFRGACFPGVARLPGGRVGGHGVRLRIGAEAPSGRNAFVPADRAQSAGASSGDRRLRRVRASAKSRGYPAQGAPSKTPVPVAPFAGGRSCRASAASTALWTADRSSSR